MENPCDGCGSELEYCPTCGTEIRSYSVRRPGGTQVTVELRGCEVCGIASVASATRLEIADVAISQYE